jgi:gamma-glutamylaminecyclotransferase
MTTLFVYGTLKKGKVRHLHMTGATFLREARTKARYALYQSPGADYPCLVDDETEGVAVEGELWEVPDDCLARLDVVEGVPDWFQRRVISLEDGQESQAYFVAKRPENAVRLGCRWE